MRRFTYFDVITRQKYPDGFGVAKYSDAQSAGKSIENTRKGDHYSAGQIVSAAPIISGLNKVAKLSQNPEPFGYYYRAFIDALLGSERLLVIGYGGRDDHINTWLEQFATKHREVRRTVWIGLLHYRPGDEPTAEETMIGVLSDRSFHEWKHCYRGDSSERLVDCGPLGLIASGFPIKSETQKAVVGFLLAT